jgi:hypothetical protein
MEWKNTADRFFSYGLHRSSLVARGVTR